MYTLFKKSVFLLIFGLLHELLAQLEEQPKNNTIDSLSQTERNITESNLGSNFESSHFWIGISILSIVGLILAGQLLVWTIYYIKTKKDENSHALLVDFEEDFIDSV